MKRKIQHLVHSLILLPTLLFACQTGPKEKVHILIAGSLVKPFNELERAYEAHHPDTDIQVEAHGSVQVIRHVTEIGDEVDVVIPADYRLIPMMMYPNHVTDTTVPYASWTMQIARNRLVLAYTPESMYADEINPNNWFEILARRDVKFGLSDPRFDAAGYRALMILQLAEDYYRNPTIFEQVLLGRFKKPIGVQKDGDTHVIVVPELLEIKEGSNVVLRGGSVALLALLESGDVDYAFEYRSVADQNNLSYILLPPEIDLSNPSNDDLYEKVMVRLDFQRFSSLVPEFKGEVITYGLTIPANASNLEGAEAFINFFLSPEGRAIMESNFHPMLSSIRVDDKASIPAGLIPLIPE